MTEDETKAELARLQKMLDARKNRPGFGDNCKAIQAKINALQAPKA